MGKDESDCCRDENGLERYDSRVSRKLYWRDTNPLQGHLGGALERVFFCPSRRPRAATTKRHGERGRVKREREKGESSAMPYPFAFPLFSFPFNLCLIAPCRPR